MNHDNVPWRSVRGQFTSSPGPGGAVSNRRSEPE